MATRNSDQPTGKRSVLVTGGTRGIGRAIADAFAEAGGDIVVTGLEQNEVEQTQLDRPDWDVWSLDLREASTIDATVTQLARLDVLVNAAGTILRDGKEHEPAEFQQVVDVNLNGTMRMGAACRRLLAESKGCVLNLASMLSFFGSGHVPAYSASKGGIVQLTKSLAIAWADEGIRVNAIAPGWIKTGLTQPLYSNDDRSRAILQRTPLARWGEPTDVTGAALFLCSPAAAFITGVVLPVDGGYSIA